MIFTRIRQLIPLVFAISAFFSCTPKEDFRIYGEVLHADPNIKMVYLFNEIGGQMEVLDSAELKNHHKFTFKVHATRPRLYQMVIGKKSFLLLTQDGEHIEFNLDYTNKDGLYKVEGSPESEALVALNVISFQASLKNKQIGDILDNAKTPEQQDALWNIYKDDIVMLNQQYALDVMTYAEKNKKKLASFYAVLLLSDMDKTTLTPIENRIITHASYLKSRFGDNPLVAQYATKVAQMANVTIGKKAPEISLKDIHGSIQQLSSFRGKYILIDFWASWCTPCRAENPNLVRVYQKYKDKKFDIFGISLDKNKDAWEKAIKDDKLTWTQVSELSGWESQVASTYVVESIPSNFLLNPEGKIIAKDLQSIDLDKILSDLLK